MVRRHPSLHAPGGPAVQDPLPEAGNKADGDRVGAHPYWKPCTRTGARVDAWMEMVLQSTVVVERPPAGPARGKWEGSPWMIILVVVIAIVGTAGYWLWRLRRARNPKP